MVNNQQFDKTNAWTFSSKNLNRDLNCYHLPIFQDKQLYTCKLGPGEIFEVISDHPSLNTLHVLRLVIGAILPSEIITTAACRFEIRSQDMNNKKGNKTFFTLPKGEKIGIGLNIHLEETPPSHCILIYDFDGKYDKNLISNMILTLIQEYVKDHIESSQTIVINPPSFETMKNLIGITLFDSLLARIHIVQPLSLQEWYLHLNFLRMEPDYQDDHMQDEICVTLPYSIIVLDDIIEMISGQSNIIFEKSLQQLFAILEKCNISLVTSWTVQQSKDMRATTKDTFRNNPNLVVKMYNYAENQMSLQWNQRVKYRLCFGTMTPFKHFAVVHCRNADVFSPFREFQVQSLSLKYNI